ncbi:uncharacterized protein [Physeter macrocephalus]|uniref:Uncharacterized protein isoform X4 n=1 Tax=Physeter macrocephalus TaxID=9755 RepID=A0A455B5H1_PHYMC|nr:uncharacterized protein LOC114486083 isoform X4 [Physeter catodon]|eukprot:XP_028344042.1 uncharacterized protein LOC114486083 isoform X3 [Physeter catodon]
MDPWVASAFWPRRGGRILRTTFSILTSAPLVRAPSPLSWVTADLAGLPSARTLFPPQHRDLSGVQICQLTPFPETFCGSPVPQGKPRLPRPHPNLHSLPPAPPLPLPSRDPDWAFATMLSLLGKLCLLFLLPLPPVLDRGLDSASPRAPSPASGFKSPSGRASFLDKGPHTSVLHWVPKILEPVPGRRGKEEGGWSGRPLVLGVDPGTAAPPPRSLHLPS